jgi:CRP-like cAMP-binding protein
MHIMSNSTNTTIKPQFAEWSNSQCAENYHGILCSLCDENYVRGTDGMCIQCEPPNIGLAVCIFVGLHAILAVVFGVLISQITDKGGTSKTANFCCRLIKNSTPLSKVHASILISYMQILSSISVAADACAWPPSFSSFVATLGIVNLDFARIVPVASCTLLLPNHVSMALHLSTPITVVVTIKTAAALATKIKNSETLTQRRHQQNFAFKTIITFVMLCYPSVCTRVFQAFRCFRVEDRFYLEADFAVECWNSEAHNIYAAVSVVYLIFFLVGVPLLLFFELWRNRMYLHGTPSSRKHRLTKERLGALYHHFEDDRWWFECCVIVVKAMLAGALTVIAPHSPLQLVIGLIICQAFLLLLMRLTPYRKDGHDVMAIFAYLSLTLTMLIGSLKSTHEYQGNSDTDQIGQRSWANLDNATLGSILICINILPFACLVGSTIKWRKCLGTADPGKATEIIPVQQTQEISDMDGSTDEMVVTQIITESEMHQREHAARQEQRQAKAKRKTMQRVEARAKLKRSRRMKQVEIFENFTDESLFTVIDRMTLQTFQAGETIVAQGDIADAFFIITEGVCSVRRKTLVDFARGQVIARLGVFEHFGEAVLMMAARKVFLAESGMSGKVPEELRNASVVAATGGDGSSTVRVLRLDMKDVERVLQSGVVDIKSLQQRIEKRHATRESLTATRQVWQKSVVYARLQENRGVKNAGSRSLFD